MTGGLGGVHNGPSAKKPDRTRRSPSIGSEIHGVDLRDDLPDETIAEIRVILLERTKEGTWLLEYLYSQAMLPEYQCRISWRPTRSHSLATAGLSTTPLRPPSMKYAQRSGSPSPGDRPFFDPKV